MWSRLSSVSRIALPSKSQTMGIVGGKMRCLEGRHSPFCRRQAQITASAANFFPPGCPRLGGEPGRRVTKRRRRSWWRAVRPRERPEQCDSQRGSGMTAIVECVPNFSEGRDQRVLDALREAITSVPGVKLLDVQADTAHHRSVFTFIGAPEAASEAAFRAMRVARERIDLNQHKGEHPRMGATDVVPFIPVEGITMDQCVELARKLCERVGKELEIPVFLYARAATRPERESLPNIRKGQFEGLREQIGKDPAKTPDFGPNRIHPTAGCTAIGARPFLVAYNIYLDTHDISLAKEIAKAIRTSSGGLPAVQASGFEVGGKAQVSMRSEEHTSELQSPLHLL